VEEKMIGLNVGSGQRKFTSNSEITWINIDKVSRPGHEPDFVCDGAHIEDAPNGSADYFVLHHVLEHFGCGEAGDLVREAKRVLKPNGSLLVFVPDMNALAAGWISGRINTQIYMTNVYGAYMGSEEDRHKWGFNCISLHDFLRKEFEKVETFNWRPIPGADIAQDWWILGMEAIK
jgi:SAM-dependent methyltransferase